MDIYVHMFFFKIYFLIFSSFYFYFFTFFQDTECKLLIMCIGEVSIGDSLLIPRFSNQLR